MNKNDSILDIKGIGEKSYNLYKRVGIENVDDLIHYFPRDYVRYEKTVSDNITTGTVISFTASVLTRPLVKRVRKLQITSCKLNLGGVLVTSTWFHMPFLNKMLEVGKSYVFRGILTAEGDHYHVEQPQIFQTDKYEELTEKINPIYSLTKGLSNNSVIKSMQQAFGALTEADYEQDLYEMHFPESYESLTRARSNLVYEEFLLFILRLRMLKEDNESSVNDFNMIEVAQTNRVIEKLPYKLTGAQMRVWDEIKEDLQKSKSMSRLVQGDVGSGKTIISFLAAIMTAVNGYQTAIMAPTEILAAQHFENLTKLINQNGLDIKPVLLTGSMTPSNKRKIRGVIESGEADVIIGTHALIQEKVTYNNLGLVVTDEQHRFGVSQREKLSDKNEKNSPHVLVMSATPIPRTLAIILYGDLSVSIIDEVPAHKLPIKNAVVDESYRQKMYNFISKEIAKGHQVYVICPLVEESEGLNAKDAVGTARVLSSVFGDDIRVGLLHGKMRPQEKQKVMDDFAKNNLQILVSTTVVEVGVNVPNATVMIVEDADRFGLAQLHQLRGRVGRGADQSYCIFMSSTNNEKTMNRLKILNETNDGFKISEEDLKQRGPGDIFGLRQSGDMQFKIADVFNDAALLKKASDAAQKILEEDPLLEKPEHSLLKERLDKSIEKSFLGKTI